MGCSTEIVTDASVKKWQEKHREITPKDQILLNQSSGRFFASLQSGIHRSTESEFMYQENVTDEDIVTR